MPNTTVSIIIPVIRPEKAERCIKAIIAQDFCRNSFPAFNEPSEFEYQRELLCCTAGYLHQFSVEILTAEDTDGIGCPRMVEKLTAMARGEHVLFLGDDTIPQPGFLQEALKAMATLPDGWGLVCLNDGVHHGNFATHWLASKNLLDHLPDRQFFNAAYNHCFCDRELTDIARDLGRYVYAPAAKIVHDHPQITGEAYDEGYKRAYKMESFLADQVTYWRRKRERSEYKLGIGFPLVDQDVPSQFMVSALCMVPHEYTLLIPRFPAGKFHDSLCSVRNDLVEQALENGCTHLLMADTDQVYPADTIQKLLEHEKDVVGVAVHRRWPPFDLVMLRGELGRYDHVPEVECYSGELVEVDATGTGCLLFDTSVFLDIPRPWFEFGTFEGKPVGEDIGLCAKIRQAGRRIYVDTSIQVEHLTTLRVNRGVREIFKRTNGHEFAPQAAR